MGLRVACAYALCECVDERFGNEATLPTTALLKFNSSGSCNENWPGLFFFFLAAGKAELSGQPGGPLPTTQKLGST